MLVSPSPKGYISISMIEGSFTAIIIALSYAWPRLGSSFFSGMERAFAKLAVRRSLSVAIVGVGAIAARLAILPFVPIPLPFVTDDFSFVLAADTFAHGRLTNPTPAMWMHFETIHVSMVPTYMSMYFPAQGLVMATGQVLLGNSWFGILLMGGFMCASICWMLQAWLPPTWALFGGLMAILRLNLFTYWINTYHSGGLIAAFAGALILGSLPRIVKSRSVRHRDGLLMGLGIAILVLTRPYDGLLLCLPVAFVLGRWILFAPNRPKPAVLFRRAAVPLALIVASIAFLSWYDYRNFGSPTTLPYSVNRQQYAIAPYFVWQHARPEPAYRYAVMRDFYHKHEAIELDHFHSFPDALGETLTKIANGTLFLSGIVLLPLFFTLRRTLFDRRIRFLVVCLLVMTAGLLIQFFFIAHYIAAFTAAIFAIALQCMRHLRHWKPEGKPVGLALVRLLVTLCLLMAGVRLCAAPLHLYMPEWPVVNWNFRWYGPGHFGTERAQIAATLQNLPGKQLAIVRYSPNHESFDEWVYNAADIDASKVIWARDMNPADNAELIRYYKDRQVWLVQPDNSPVTLTPYPMQSQPVPAGQASH